MDGGVRCSGFSPHDGQGLEVLFVLERAGLWTHRDSPSVFLPTLRASGFVQDCNHELDQPDHADHRETPVALDRHERGCTQKVTIVVA